MIQPLEARRHLTVTVSDNVLLVRGTVRPETITLAWKQVDANNWTIRINDGKKTTEQAWSSSAAFNAVSIYGGNGADFIASAVHGGGFATSETPPIPVSINGGALNDTIIATNAADSILGGSGHDNIRASAGDDVVDGEGGKDTIRGGVGNDTLRGGANSDRLLGDAGNDSLFGDAAADSLDGGLGDDVLQGGGGLDSLFAGDITAGPFFRGANTDNDQDTLWGSTANEPDDWGDQRYL